MQSSTIAFKLAALAGLTAVGGKLHGAKIMLFTAPVLVTENVQLTDLTEATFTGYAEVAVPAWSAPYVDPNGNAFVDGGGTLFQPTDAVIQETIYGFAIVSTAVVGPPAIPVQVVYLETFATPVPLTDATKGVVVDVSIPYGV